MGGTKEIRTILSQKL